MKNYKVYKRPHLDNFLKTVGLILVLFQCLKSYKKSYS